MKHIPAPFPAQRAATSASLRMRPQTLGPGVHWPAPALKPAVGQQRPAQKSVAPPAYRPFAAASAVQQKPVRAFAPAVVQLMKKKRDNQKKIQQRSNRKEEKFLSENEGAHVEEFHSYTSSITPSTGANTVLSHATINGALATGAGPFDTDAEARITTPDYDNDSIKTTGDGEVSELIRALRSFNQFVATDTGANHVSFDLSLSGAWGACDGCKKRIAAFVDVWTRQAAALLRQGRTATLRVTYRYINPPTELSRKWGSIVYGWYEDTTRSSPYFRTIAQNATGTAT
jgi:hypothetical protein